jgi:hypothetical protein
VAPEYDHLGGQSLLHERPWQLQLAAPSRM